MQLITSIYPQLVVFKIILISIYCFSNIKVLDGNMYSTNFEDETKVYRVFHRATRKRKLKIEETGEYIGKTLKYNSAN